MADKTLTLTLAKVIVAAAWADGQMSPEEQACLKDLTFQLATGAAHDDPISGAEWARLEMYVDAPVNAAERQRLVADLQAALQQDADRQLALAALETMVRADGDVTQAETAVLDEVRQALHAAQLGGLGRLRALVGGALQRRMRAVAAAPNRETEFDDYVRNKVYYAVRQRLAADAEVPDAALRRLSLAGGLMAHVAHVDGRIAAAEQAAIVAALQRDWSLSAAAAALVAEVALAEVSKALDYYRMTREFFQQTDAEERRRFLDVLFAVAAADGAVSEAETAVIHRIARSLGLRQSHFRQAAQRSLGA
ncbi:MAG: TerB family tellurite resistance protein [Anaerolineales bacterium]|nr:TerB family tellurite resistance protein [Anaerolineales bacterium]